MTTKLSSLLFMIGLYFLGRGVMRAGEYRPRLVRIAISLPTLLIALVCVAMVFSFADRGHTTATFMSDYGDQPLVGAYSITVFSDCGVVLAAMLALAIGQCRVTQGKLRVPAALLAIGASCGIALCVTVVFMDVTHMIGALDLMHLVDAAYGPLTLATFSFLCAGFVAQPATRSVLRRLRGVRTDAFLIQLDPIWRNATKLRPGLSKWHPASEVFEDPGAKLYRRVVEIRDAMIDQRVVCEISPTDLALLKRAEKHLLVQGISSPTSSRFASTDLDHVS